MAAKKLSEIIDKAIALDDNPERPQPSTKVLQVVREYVVDLEARNERLVEAASAVVEAEADGSEATRCEYGMHAPLVALRAALGEHR